jgi:hypothetical protein
MTEPALVPPGGTRARLPAGRSASLVAAGVAERACPQRIASEASVTDERDDHSVISNLQGFTWSTSESVAYEAAVEAISEAVGAYSAVIAAEEASKNPSRRVLERARAGQAACVRSREQLDPSDRAAVTSATIRTVQS